MTHQEMPGLHLSGEVEISAAGGGSNIDNHLSPGLSFIGGGNGEFLSAGASPEAQREDISTFWLTASHSGTACMAEAQWTPYGTLALPNGGAQLVSANTPGADTEVCPLAPGGVIHTNGALGAFMGAASVAGCGVSIYNANGNIPLTLIAVGQCANGLMGGAANLGDLYTYVSCSGLQEQYALTGGMAGAGQDLCPSDFGLGTETSSGNQTYDSSCSISDFGNNDTYACVGGVGTVTITIPQLQNAEFGGGRL